MRGKIRVTGETVSFESSEELAALMAEVPNGGRIRMDATFNVQDSRNDVPGLRWSAPPGPLTVRRATAEELSH